jgi:hypothetical protein
MSNHQETGFGFRIRPLSEPDKPSEKPSTPEPQKNAPPLSKGTEQDVQHTSLNNASDHFMAARFQSAQSALTFIGSVAGAGLANEARARKGPGTDWWIEIPVSWDQASILASNARGKVYAGFSGIWTVVPFDGSAPTLPDPPPKKQTDAINVYESDGMAYLDHKQWPETGFMDLICASPLYPAQPRNIQSVVVITPGVLSASIIKRAVQLGLHVSAGAAEQEPLAGGDRSAIAWLEMTWESSRWPQAFLRSLTRLPYTAVTRPVLPDLTTHSGLLIDINHATPLTASLIVDLMPSDEYWLLGAPETGHWRIQQKGSLTDASTLIQLPEQPSVTSHARITDIPTPEINLRLIQSPPLLGYPDALLLDEKECEWLKNILMGRPEAETTYLIPGQNYFLLIAPGGLTSSMPFGIPLRCIGPNGLYLQECRAFYPPLPENARKQAFPCTNDHIKVVIDAPKTSRMATLQFQLQHLIPVWQLWMVDGPEVLEGVSKNIAKTLKQLSKKNQLPKPKPLQKQLARMLPKSMAPTQKASPETLRQQALSLIHKKQFAEAARYMEQAGDMATAARLYEKAAEEH